MFRTPTCRLHKDLDCPLQGPEVVGLRPAIVKALLAAGSVGVLMAAATSCAAMKAAGTHAAEGGGAAGGGALFYVLATMSGVAGWAAAGLAGIGGWIGAWFFTPKAPPGAAPAGFPWGGLVVVALIVLALRAWAHYPEMLRHLWALVKVAARGLLGGLKRPPTGS